MLMRISSCVLLRYLHVVIEIGLSCWRCLQLGVAGENRIWQESDMNSK
jgi:hypothetical protein